MVGVSDARMSPDGQAVLFARKVVNERNGYETSLWVADAGGKRAPRALTRGPRHSCGRWSPDGSVVAYVRADQDRAPSIETVPARGGRPRTVATMPHGTIRDLAWSPCGRRLAFAFRPLAADWTPKAAKKRAARGGSTPPRVIDDVWYRLDGDGYFDGARFALHVVEVGGARRCTPERVFDRDTLGSFSFDWSPDGSCLVVATNMHPRASWEPWHATLVVVTPGTGGRHRVAELKGLPPGVKRLPCWSPDGMCIAYAGRRGKDDGYSTDDLELWCYDLRTRRARSLTSRSGICLMAATLSDASDAAFEPQLRWFPDSGAIFFRAGIHGSGIVASVPADGGAVVQHSTPGAECSLGTFCADGSRLSVVRGTPTAIPEVHVADVEGRLFPLRRVTGLNDSLMSELRLVEPEERWIRAADGHPVHCWVMRPRAARGRRPAILEVHGGPHAQYGCTYFHEFQLLCAQGYEVWFSNPRGSKGYGAPHCGAIRGAWGTKDWTDVQAVLRAMRASPTVDRTRVGIMGGSYGGYMTNWAIAHDHGLRAAITDRCVSNLVSHAGNSDHPEVPDRYWRGAAFDRPEALWRASPIAHFKGVRTPTLVIHSEGDLRCNVEQGEQVFTALCTLGVPARFVRYPRESSHGMSRAGPPDLRIHRLREILAWWARWMGR